MLIFSATSEQNSAAKAVRNNGANAEVARGTAKNSQTSIWDDLAIQLIALGRIINDS